MIKNKSDGGVSSFLRSKKSEHTHASGFCGFCEAKREQKISAASKKLNISVAQYTLLHSDRMTTRIVEDTDGKYPKRKRKVVHESESEYSSDSESEVQVKDRQILYWRVDGLINDVSAKTFVDSTPIGNVFTLKERVEDSEAILIASDNARLNRTVTATSDYNGVPITVFFGYNKSISKSIYPRFALRVKITNGKRAVVVGKQYIEPTRVSKSVKAARQVKFARPPSYTVVPTTQGIDTTVLPLVKPPLQINLVDNIPEAELLVQNVVPTAVPTAVPTVQPSEVLHHSWIAPINTEPANAEHATPQEQTFSSEKILRQVKSVQPLMADIMNSLRERYTEQVIIGLMSSPDIIETAVKRVMDLPDTNERVRKQLMSDQTFMRTISVKEASRLRNDKAFRAAVELDLLQNNMCNILPKSDQLSRGEIDLVHKLMNARK